MTHTQLAPARTRSSSSTRRAGLAGLTVALVGLAYAPAASAGPLVGDDPRSSYIVVDDDAPARAVAGAATDGAAVAPTLIYLNRNGGTYRPGRDSAGANTSSILDRAATIPRWDVSDAGWNKVVDRVDGMMARWHVEVTDQDPGDVPHYEVVLGGEPEDAGQNDGYAGVAPFSSACRALPSAVVYTFVERIDSN